jgi:hypothetical protein
MVFGNKKNNFVILVILILLAGIVFVIFSNFYFKNLLKEERQEIKKEMERIVQGLKNQESAPISSKTESMSPEILARLKKTAIERYFLSEVELIDGIYTSTIFLCLFELGKPIYPSYIYGTKSMSYYPNTIAPEIALVRYLLLPEDNSDFQPDKGCFIKEIKIDKDWQEVKQKYNFSKDLFM